MVNGKMTYAEAITKAMAEVQTVEVNDRLQDLLDSLNKKASAKRMSPNQVANAKIKDDLLDFITDNPSCCISQIQSDTRFSGFTNQKISSLLTQLIKDNLVEKSYIEKKKPIYCIVE